MKNELSKKDYNEEWKALSKSEKKKYCVEANLNWRKRKAILKQYSQTPEGKAYRMKVIEWENALKRYYPLEPTPVW